MSESNNCIQFAELLGQANDTLGRKCSVACTDAGYNNTDELKSLNDQGIKVIVPQQKHTSNKKDISFD